MKEKIMIVLLGIVVCSCEEVQNASSFEDKPVVESYIFPDSAITVTISKLISYDPNAVYSDENVDSLDLTISCSTGTYSLISQSDGSYVLPTGVYLPHENTEYTLSFEYNDKEVIGTTKILAKPQNFIQSATTYVIPEMGPGQEMPDPLELSWSNDDNSYYLVIIENIEADPTPVNSNMSNDTLPRIFRNEPTSGNSFQISSRQFQYLGTHRIILFHINPDYTTLYNNTETNSINITSPVSSIQNALGIFTGINSDTLWLEVTH